MVRYDPRDDFYTRLGARETATQDELRLLYRARARLFHPDGHRTPDLANREMALLNEAWAVLRDPGRRRGYDQARANYLMSRLRPRIEARVATARKRNVPGNAERKGASRVCPTSRDLIVRAAPKHASAKGFLVALAKPRVLNLAREGRKLEAILLTVGAAVSDAYLADLAQPALRSRRRPRRERG